MTTSLRIAFACAFFACLWNARPVLRAADDIQDVVRDLQSSERQVTKQAAEKLRQYAADGKVTEPVLAALLKHEDFDVRLDAAVVLIDVIAPTHEEALRELKSLLHNDRLRGRTSIRLGELGKRHPNIIDLVVSLALDPEQDLTSRLYAFSSLCYIGPPAAKTVPQLIPFLDDQEFNIRNAAAGALGEIGPDARQALPKLADKVRQGTFRLVPDLGVEGMASALVKIDPGNADAERYHLLLLQSWRYEWRIRGVSHLSGYQSLSDDVRAALEKAAASDSSSNVRQIAARTLEELPKKKEEKPK
jgi:HEAT repeat protein